KCWIGLSGGGLTDRASHFVPRLLREGGPLVLVSAMAFDFPHELLFILTLPFPGAVHVANLNTAD
ncbi:MAG TPA: hypothetical protein VGQ71_06585, partial [Terriglobales bacterium]|nr:hypothetical protein [Terriglobales bacterium]